MVRTSLGRRSGGVRLFTEIAATFLCVFSSFWAHAAEGPQPTGKPAVAELFEDDAENLLKLLTNPGDGMGQGEPEAKVVFSGTHSLKVTQYQRFQRRMPGWSFPIREKPKAGEYRFLRFAWRAEGAQGLMLQLHDSLDWNIRYTAGSNSHGWASKRVSDKALPRWTLVTVDLFRDFGERTLTGIAFTIDGGPGYFDHVYLGATEESLDQIDANGMKGKKLPLTDAELAGHWARLVDEDAALAYRAYWTLAAGGARSASFLEGMLAPSKTAAVERIRQWIRDLNDEDFATRENATAMLRKEAAAAIPQLEAALAGAPPLEVRRRIELLLAGMTGRDAERNRREIARRLQRLIKSLE